MFTVGHYAGYNLKGRALQKALMWEVVYYKGRRVLFET